MFALLLVLLCLYGKLVSLVIPPIFLFYLTSLPDAIALCQSQVCRNNELREIDFLFTSVVVMYVYRCMGAFGCVVYLQRNNNQITI